MQPIRLLGWWCRSFFAVQTDGADDGDVDDVDDDVSGCQSKDRWTLATRFPLLYPLVV